MTESKQTNTDFLERRRQLLRLGATGVPMVLTLKASAAQPIHSALDCLFVIPKKVRILVNEDGKTWVGDGNIKKKQGKFKVSDIEKFKRDADFVFPNGSAPEQYRPDACPPPNPACDDDDDGDDDDDDDFGRFGAGQTGILFGTSGDDLLNGLLAPRQVASAASFRADDDDDDDDDECDEDTAWTDCGYNFYKINKNTTITPSDYLSGGGAWQLNGKNGLYIALANKYLDTYGNDGGFPGISCLLSILNYLDMQ